MQVAEHFTGRNSVLCPCCHQPVEGAKFLADPITGMVTNGFVSVSLTPQEIRLARHLFDAFPGMSTKERIHEQVILDIHGQGPGPKIIDVLVCKIRPKLSRIGVAIETVWGRGYRVVEVEPGQAEAIKYDSIRVRTKGSAHRWTEEDEFRLTDLMKRGNSATVCATIMKLPYSTVTRAYKRLQSTQEVA